MDFLRLPSPPSPGQPAPRGAPVPRPPLKRGISLVEVMIAATIFTVLSMSATALFLQNQRASISMRYRTQVTNTALNILEQLRVESYSELKALRDKALAAPTSEHSITVLIASPAYVPPTPDPYASLNLPDGLKPIELTLNVVDDKVIDLGETYIDLPMESGASTVNLETRYWLTLKFKEAMDPSTGIVQAMEIALIYQWKAPRRSDWFEGTIRLVVPNPQAVKTIIATP